MPELAPQVSSPEAQAAWLLGGDDETERRRRWGEVDVAGRGLAAEVGQASAALSGASIDAGARGLSQASIHASLRELRSQIEALDPAGYRLDGKGFRAALGKLPFVATPMERYFAHYEAAQAELAATMRSLESSRLRLRDESAHLVAQRTPFAERLEELRAQATHLAAVDAALGAKAPEELRRRLRVRVLDLKQQLVVGEQALQSVTLVIASNDELSRRLRQTLDVTTAALEVAVGVAFAFLHRRVVLDRVTRLEQASAALSPPPRGQEVGDLESAFARIRRTLDEAIE